MTRLAILIAFLVRIGSKNPWFALTSFALGAVVGLIGDMFTGIFDSALA